MESKNISSKFPNLQFLIWKKNKTLVEIARTLDISAVSLSRKLNGKREFTMPEIKGLIDIFKIPFDILFSDKPDAKLFADDKDKKKQEK